jgi:hypothetical protein
MFAVKFWSLHEIAYEHIVIIDLNSDIYGKEEAP